jgi:hypothetical protein
MAVVAFFISFGVFGVLGAIPWDKWNGNQEASWQMDYLHAWFYWAFFVSLASMAVAGIVYAVGRWGR